MDKCIYKGVDIFNPIAGKMKYFIDAFVTVYGEHYRPVIEKRLKNANYYFLGGKFSNIILKYQQLEQEEIKKVEKTPNITPALIKLKKKDIHERYQLIINIFKETQKRMDMTSIKYSDAINELILKEINAIRTINKLPVLPKLEAQRHASTYMDLLSVTKTDFVRKKSLFSENKKQEFVNFFKALGYNEKSFNDYLKNKKLLNNLFDYDLIKQINALNNAKVEELNKINFCVAELKYQLNDLNIYGDKKQFEEIGSQYIQNKTSNSAFVVNCLTYNSEFKSLCFCKNALDLTTEDLVHEMGHIIDAFVVESNKNGFYYKNGFELNYYGFNYDAMKSSSVPMYGEKGYRHCELFNEMVNEYITLKVSNELKKTGKTFTFASRENTSGVIKYAFGFEVFSDFLEKYQDKLIELKLKVDKNQGAYEYFGEENFQRLTTIAKEYIEKRTELNSECLRGYQEAYAEIEEYRAETLAEIKQLEEKIDKHITKNEIKKNIENQQLWDEKKSSKNETSQPEKTNKKLYTRPKFIIKFDNLFKKSKNKSSKTDNVKESDVKSLGE